MTPDNLTKTEFVIAGLELFPPSVREKILSDRAFRTQHGLRFNATIKFAPSRLVLSREALFDAIRALLSRTGKSSMAISGSDWSVALEDRNGTPHLVLIGNDQLIDFEPYFFLSPDVHERLAWFDRELADLELESSDLSSWRDLLTNGQLDNDDVEPLLTELRHAPIAIRGAIERELGRAELRGNILVPGKRAYYERLIGSSNMASFLEYVTLEAKQKIENHLEDKSLDGLKAALAMSAHSNLTQLIDLRNFEAATVDALFEWLLEGGDLISQIGGIEIGFAAMDVHPQLEASLLPLCQKLAVDDPINEQSRWRLFNSLYVLAESELAKADDMRVQPPYWRRLASITQAAIVERALRQSQLRESVFNDWIEGGREFVFYCQTLCDLREEPRWMPDFAHAEQWRNEFLGRIYSAARKHESCIKSHVLRELVLTEGDGSIRSKVDYMRALLPGPLEGGGQPIMEMPDEFQKDLQAKLQEDVLTPLSFAALTNTVLIYRLGPNVTQVATDALKRARHDLRKVGAGQQAFSLLSGLAITAAVTRNRDLADEVRTIARSLQRRLGEKIHIENMIRIAVIAAASRADVESWSRFAGEWLTEMAFEDISQGEANVLATYINGLRHMESTLWRNCTKAMAACNSLLAA